MAEQIRMTISELEAKKFINFFSNYRIQGCLVHSSKKRYLGDKKNKKCRFCGRTSQDVTFRKKAHAIPQLLGNKNILSYFECDSCNDVFGVYENSLAGFLGAMRTFAQIKGKKGTGIPVYKNEKTGFRVEVDNSGVKMSHHIEHEREQEVEVDMADKSLTIKTIRPPYYPIHVFKILVKIGFCMLEEEELPNFAKTREWLMTSDRDVAFRESEQFRVYRHFVPGPPMWPESSATLFTKIESKKDEPIPEKIISLNLANQVLQFSIPFGERDQTIARIDRRFSIHIAPVLLTKERIEKYGSYSFGIVTLSSPERVVGEEDTITFAFESAVEQKLDGDAQGE